MIAVEDDNFDPYEFQAQVKNEAKKLTDNQEQYPVITDKHGYKMTKDGFYLKDSDEEEEDPMAGKNRKERKKILRAAAMAKMNAKQFESDHSSDSDYSDSSGDEGFVQGDHGMGAMTKQSK